MKAVIFSGSREIWGHAALMRIHSIINAVEKFTPHYVVGDAKGVDSLVMSMLKELKIPPERINCVVADWSSGKSGGHLRNSKMIEIALSKCENVRECVLHAFPNIDETKRKGTDNCIKQADAAGIVVVIHGNYE